MYKEKEKKRKKNWAKNRKKERENATKSVDVVSFMFWIVSIACESFRNPESSYTINRYYFRWWFLTRYFIVVIYISNLQLCIRNEEAFGWFILYGQLTFYFVCVFLLRKCKTKNGFDFVAHLSMLLIIALLLVWQRKITINLTTILFFF